jgi:hypothetical protein
MLRCLKCNAMVSDTSKICRKCGSILQVRSGEAENRWRLRKGAIMDPKETMIPTVLLVLGIAMYVAFGFWMGGAGGAGALLVMTLIGLVIGIPLGIIACFITAWLMGASFGTLKGAILKLAAVYTFPSGVLLLAMTSLSIEGVLLGLLVGLVLFGGLLAWLFELDALEVIVVAIVLFVVRLGVSFAAELLFLGAEG